MQNHVGKTIQMVERESVESDTCDYERLTITFDDGSEMKVESSDFEGYQSSLLIDEEIDV